MSNDAACLNCELALICEAAPYKFARRLAVVCRDHRVAFTNITQAEAEKYRRTNTEPGFNWMGHTEFSQNWNVPCPCVLLRACPKFVETSDVLRVNFKIVMDEPLVNMHITFKPFKKK